MSNPKGMWRATTNLGGPSFASTLVPLVGTSDTKSPERLELVFFGSDFSGAFCSRDSRQGDGGTGSLGFEVIRLEFRS